MIPSIRTFLLINLLLSVTLITSFAVISNLFLEHKEVQNYLDQQLAFRALNIQAFASGFTDKNNQLQQVQNRISEIPELTTQLMQKPFPTYEELQVQIWNKQGQLLLSSPHAPQSELIAIKAIPIGFSDQWIHGEQWRFFINRDPQTGNTVLVSEKYELREALETHITRDSIFIMLISYPFLGILIWIIVGRGLDSLKRIASEVRNREPSFLQPVNAESVPGKLSQ